MAQARCGSEFFAYSSPTHLMNGDVRLASTSSGGCWAMTVATTVAFLPVKIFSLLCEVM